MILNKGVNLVNDIIRLHDAVNFDSVQQAFELTRISLGFQLTNLTKLTTRFQNVVIGITLIRYQFKVITLNLITGFISDRIKPYTKNELQKTLYPYFKELAWFFFLN